MNDLVPRLDAEEVDLVAYFADELAKRFDDLQRAAGRVETIRSLLAEARAAQGTIPQGRVLTLERFVPEDVHDVTTASRRALIAAAFGEVPR